MRYVLIDNKPYEWKESYAFGASSRRPSAAHSSRRSSTFATIRARLRNRPRVDGTRSPCSLRWITIATGHPIRATLDAHTSARVNFSPHNVCLICQVRSIAAFSPGTTRGRLLRESSFPRGGSRPPSAGKLYKSPGKVWRLFCYLAVVARRRVLFPSKM
jgi:hypothetical protein